MRLLLFIWLWACACLPARAQGLSSLLKNGETAWKNGEYAAAAAYWEQAGRLKNGDPELLYKAAEAFMGARLYAQAAACYKSVGYDRDYPLAPLRYARALKQQGLYAEARAAFEAFGAQYTAAYKAVVMSVVENELAGCALVLDSTLTTQGWVRPVFDSVDLQENTFAPIAFSDKLLYFSQATAERSLLMRSTRKGERWNRAETARALPEAVAGRYATGCFSPDRSRFYYTLSDNPPNARTGGSARVGKGEIYCLRRTDEGWAEPEKLPAYINLEGSTAQFPHVAHYGNTEYLFFSSDRPGGFGGADLYVCERPLDSEALDFSFPQNLGIRINTGADEVTPWYDPSSATLWFSTIGHPSLGGLDIFSSEKTPEGWTRPVNLGAPFNSPADDCFFVLKNDGMGAFFSSNRKKDELPVEISCDGLYEAGW